MSAAGAMSRDDLLAVAHGLVGARVVARFPAGPQWATLTGVSEMRDELTFRDGLYSLTVPFSHVLGLRADLPDYNEGEAA